MIGTGKLPENAPGWFGKVPMLGDFAQRRLPPAFVATCDPWLSQCVQATRLSMGESWLDWYLTAPIWNFALAPQIVDKNWWFGVLMPSVDAVGRYFPLLIASPAPHVPVAAHSLAALESWYDYVGRCALDALQPGMTVDSLERLLLAPPALLPADEEPDSQIVVRRNDTGDWSISAARNSWPRNAGANVLAAVTTSLEGQTMWWRRPGTNDFVSELCTRRGLPAPERLVETLSR